MKIENAKQKYRKNNMNNTLKSVTLHYLIIKSKLNIWDIDFLKLKKLKLENQKLMFLLIKWFLNVKELIMLYILKVIFF